MRNKVVNAGNGNRKMAAGNHFKNKAVSKNHRVRGNILSYFVVVALIVAAAFTSCDKDDDHGVVSGSITQIIAKISNASEFPDVATVKLLAWNNDVLAEADFINGGFTIDLPETVDGKYLHQFDEIFFYYETLTISKKDAKALHDLRIYGYNSSGKRIAVFSNEKYVGNEYSEIYAMTEYLWVDNDVNISGSYKDTEDKDYVETYSVSLILKKGWNVVYMSENDTEKGYKVEIKTSPISGLKWIGDRRN